MPKTALVLGGGGSRGAYEIGVWQAMRELEIEIDIVTGSSVGSINGAAVAQGGFEEAVRLWNELTTDMIFELSSPSAQLPSRLGPFGKYAREFVERGGAGCEALRKLLGEMLEEDKIRRSRIRFGLVTVELSGMRARSIFIEDIPKGKLVDYLLASSACFPAMKYSVIDGTKFIDGGYRDNVPVKMARDAGAERIIAVDLKAIGIVDEKTMQKESGVITRISPAEELGNFLEFNGAGTRFAMRLGYLDGLKALGGYEGYGYCFLAGETGRLRRRLLTKCVGIAIECGIPIGGKSGIIDGIAAAQLGRHLGEVSGSTSLADAILVLAEDAGRVFEMPVDTIYSGNAFTRTLTERAAAFISENGDEILGLRLGLARLSPSSLGTLLKDRGGKLFTTALVQEMRQPDKTQDNLARAASIYPKEFSAALFLAALL